MDEFLQMIVDVFSATFFGITAWNAIGGALVILLFVVLRGVFARRVIAYLSKLTARTKTDVDDKILNALSSPLKFIPIIAGVFFLTQWFGLPDNIIVVLLSLTRSLVAFTIFWAAYNVLTPFSELLESLLEKLTEKSETLFAEEFTGLIIKGLKITTVGVGIIIILSQS